MTEYAYYNRETNKYNHDACNDARCVKLDCHEKTSDNFKLLGYFKEPLLDQFLQELFENQGDCLWSDEEYNDMMMMGGSSSSPSSKYQIIQTIMSNGCTRTNTEVDMTDWNSGQQQQMYLYVDMKPSKYGDIGFGLYTDNRCSTEYVGNEYTVGQVLQNAICTGLIYGGSSSYYSTMCQRQQSDTNNTTTNDNVGYSYPWDLDEDLLKWNDAFDVYKQCQPCKASAITSYVSGSSYNSTGTRGIRTNAFNNDQYYNNYNDNNNEEEQEEPFTCNGEYGMAHVNQVS